MCEENKKELKEQYITLPHKELEEEQETKLQSSERKEKINISGQINEIQNRNTREKINKKIGS